MSLSIKSVLPRTLFARSLMILVTPVLLIQIITTIVFFDRHWNRMIDRLAFAVAGEISIFAEEIDNRVNDGTLADAEGLQQLKAHAIKHLDMLVSYKPDESYDTFVKEMDAGQRSFITKALERQLNIKLRRPYHINIDVNEKWIEVAVMVEQGVLLVSMPQRRLFSSSGYIFILWMIGVSITLLAIAILFMRGQIRPIRRLAIVADRFGRGQDVPDSFKPEGGREVRQAAEAFVKMRNRIQKQIEQRTVMLAGVSHDLRTPLTRMKLQAAMLEQNPDVDALKSDIDDMGRMLDAYLEFVKGTGREKSERVNVSNVLNELVAKMKRAGETIHMDIDSDVFVSGRPVALQRCFSNILSNAKRYAGGEVWIALHKLESKLEVIIDDNGDGIPAEERENVFKPFVRGDESRNNKTGGVGLGLSISQDTVYAHGGNIELDDSPHGGLRVIIHLPF